MNDMKCTTCGKAIEAIWPTASPEHSCRTCYENGPGKVQVELSDWSYKAFMAELAKAGHHCNQVEYEAAAFALLKKWNIGEDDLKMWSLFAQTKYEHTIKMVNEFRGLLNRANGGNVINLNRK